jgi:hypothetical protein
MNCANCHHPQSEHGADGCHRTVERNPYESWLCHCEWSHGTAPTIRGKALMTLPLSERRKVMQASAEAFMASGEPYEDLWADSDSAA